MAQDFSLAIRRAALPALKAGGPLTSMVPPDRIYPVTVPAKPTFPFIRYGVSTTTPFRASGLDTSAVAVAIHAFTMGRIQDGATVETAEDHAHKLADAIGAALDEATLDLGGGFKGRVTWTGSNVLIDGDEPAAWHAVVNFRIEVSG